MDIDFQGVYFWSIPEHVLSSLSFLCVCMSVGFREFTVVVKLYCDWVSAHVQEGQAVQSLELTGQFAAASLQSHRSQE